MPTNSGTIISIKNNNNEYVSLYPNTTSSQIEGFDIGSVSNVYTITLAQSNWTNNQQIVSLDGVSVNDYVYCTLVLSGTTEQMSQQLTNYNLLDSRIGVESLTNQLKFTCTTEPTIDLQVQVFWTN